MKVIIQLLICTSIAISQSGLVAFYPFNGNPNDESGNGNHGVEQGGISLTADRFGIENSAYYFDGDDDYLLITTI